MSSIGQPSFTEKFGERSAQNCLEKKINGAAKDVFARAERVKYMHELEERLAVAERFIKQLEIEEHCMKEFGMDRLDVERFIRRF
ncbi:Glycine--tRNA ligase [Frankliniella fusca]|uniref:Glycine--tRNA ligase n=1 Tax=Frankliniella fusca TaxID=407009 RepID=A0AAE1LUJ5_9NEOP|nr:Glycine--tRNA ligase [Frankliniella fusca]